MYIQLCVDNYIHLVEAGRVSGVAAMNVMIKT